jgi:uncharacterized protein YxjI
MFGNRRQERQEERQTFGQGGSANRYQMRQRMIAIGDEYWIENEAGAKVFRIKGKVLRVRKTLIFEDAHGNELAKIQERMLHIKDTMAIEGPHGESLAVVKKALVAVLHDRFTINVKNGPDLEVRGNILDYEYTISEGHNKVAEVSKKWFRLRDSYGVEIAPGQDNIIILAVTVVIDQLAHKGR